MILKFGILKDQNIHYINLGQVYNNYSLAEIIRSHAFQIYAYIIFLLYFILNGYNPKEKRT